MTRVDAKAEKKKGKQRTYSSRVRSESPVKQMAPVGGGADGAAAAAADAVEHASIVVN